MIVQAVKTARKVALWVKMRANVLKTESSTIVCVASAMLISMEWIFARRCSSVEVG